MVDKTLVSSSVLVAASVLWPFRTGETNGLCRSTIEIGSHAKEEEKSRKPRNSKEKLTRPWDYLASNPLVAASRIIGTPCWNPPPMTASNPGDGLTRFFLLGEGCGSATFSWEVAGSGVCRFRFHQSTIGRMDVTAVLLEFLSVHAPRMQFHLAAGDRMVGIGVPAPALILFQSFSCRCWDLFLGILRSSRVKPRLLPHRSTWETISVDSFANWGNFMWFGTLLPVLLSFQTFARLHCAWRSSVLWPIISRTSSDALAYFEC